MESLPPFSGNAERSLSSCCIWKPSQRFWEKPNCSLPCMVSRERRSGERQACQGSEYKNKSCPQGKFQRNVCILKEASKRTFLPTKQTTMVMALQWRSLVERVSWDSQNHTTKPLYSARFLNMEHHPDWRRRGDYLWQTRKHPPVIISD